MSSLQGGQTSLRARGACEPASLVGVESLGPGELANPARNRLDVY